MSLRTQVIIGTIDLLNVIRSWSLLFKSSEDGKTILHSLILNGIRLVLIIRNMYSIKKITFNSLTEEKIELPSGLQIHIDKLFRF
ncbi:hypothetical protein LEP1GSC058_0268 [Leptospira fainei serovar Hurstbridge str. BUT 6]|uniref:Uncharacterized protein n=1 Tax=Leptospira fainei serovar Hurstbridge str. BUT 6 TaxID=1193011 RepID=S3UT76_9LEPT|nr:hypothetical protein LEP1GSC058_0268 [Leptospira fainei serovar Hurstbridge str. BUT 6]